MKLNKFKEVEKEVRDLGFSVEKMEIEEIINLSKEIKENLKRGKREIKYLKEKRNINSIINYNPYKENLKVGEINNLKDALNLTINQIIEGDALENLIKDDKDLIDLIAQYFWVNLDNNRLFSDCLNGEFGKYKKEIFVRLYLKD
jgi:seryl-tRNA synthetase